MSLKNSLINITEFCKIMNIENVSNKLIIKLYRLLRNIIKKNYHLNVGKRTFSFRTR